MFSRSYQDSDYNTIMKWWSDWGWQPVPRHFLPPNGVVIGDEEGIICAVFLYKTDTPIVWVENYISDKKARKERRFLAMSMLLDAANDKVKEMGGAVMMSAVRHNGLAKRLFDFGFKKADENLTNYICEVV